MRLALSLLRRRCSSRSPRPLPRINWWCVTLLVASIGLSVGTVAGFKPGADWAVLEYAAREAGTPALYAERGSGGTATFVWSPVAAHLLQLLTPVGMYVWMAASFAAAFAMPTWRLRLIVLVSWPFWSDVMTGNLLTVIFLSAVWALRGSTVGTLTFFAFSLLIPRPLLLPTVLWILWRRTEWRWRFAAMFAVHTLAVWWTGLGPTWIETVLTTGPGLQELVINLGPTRFLGYWWMVVGVPLGAWLFWRGHVGWAGLAISNYVWVYYLYFMLPDANNAQRQEPAVTPPSP